VRPTVTATGSWSNPRTTRPAAEHPARAESDFPAGGSAVSEAVAN
jgi:hypothetical protein